MRRAFTDARLLGSAALIGALLAVALWPSTLVVDLVQVSRGPLVVTIAEEGRTRVRDRFVVTTPLAGQIRRIELQTGDRVARGDVVARLHPAAPALLDARMRAEAIAKVKSTEAALAHARADERQARAVLAQAGRDLMRTRHLYGAGMTTADELEASEAAVSRAADTATAATFAVRLSSADVERANARLAAFRSIDTEGFAIRAPIDGVVLQRYRESERVVAAGEPLVEIGDVRQLEIVTALRSTEAVKVNPGDRAIIVRWGGGSPLAAIVRRIEPAGVTTISTLGVEEQRVNVILDIVESGEACATLGDAYRVDVQIVLWESADVVKVPTNTLVRDGPRWAVYVASEGRARLAIVDLGRHTGQEAEVTKGLPDGAMVVVHPSDLMRDGVRIAPRSER